MIDIKEFVSDVVTSLTLYASIPRFGMMLTKDVLKVLASYLFKSLLTVGINVSQS